MSITELSTRLMFSKPKMSYNNGEEGNGRGGGRGPPPQEEILMNFFKSRKKIIITLALVLGVVGGFFNVEEVNATAISGDRTKSYGQSKLVDIPDGSGKTHLNITGGINYTKFELETIAENSSLVGIFSGKPGDKNPQRIDATSQGGVYFKGDYFYSDGKGRFMEFNTGENDKLNPFDSEKQDDELLKLTIYEPQTGLTTTYGTTGNFSSTGITDPTTQKAYIDDILVTEHRTGADFQKIKENANQANFGDKYDAWTNEIERQSNAESLTNLRKENQILQDALDGMDADDPQRASTQALIDANRQKISELAKNQTTLANRNNSLGTRATTEINKGECGVTAIPNCIAQLFYYILFILSNLVGFAGNLLNTVMEYTVEKMSAFIGEISAINAGWTAIRDLVNIFFIFILLYIAISTILGLDEHGAKHALAKVIIFGVLINFSMFFTKVIIDASNIFTLQFYTKITQQENGGMGTAIMGAFKVTSIFNASSADSNDAAKAFAGNTQNSGTVFVMGLIMILVAISVLLGATWIFLKRFVVFVFLLISSPLAFAGMILHSTEHYAKQWWGALMAEVIAAPVLMIMLWLAFTIMQTGIYTIATATSGGLANELGMIGISNGSRTGIIFNFAIISMLLSFCLVAAQKLGASGGAGALKIYGGAMGAFKGAGNWMGRNTLGAGAYNLLEKTKFGTQTLKQLRQHSNPLVRGFGRMLVGGLQKVGHGHHEDIEQDKKNFEDTLNELRDNPKAKAEFLAKQLSGKARMGGLMQPYNQKIAKYVTVGMKEDELATTALFMQDQGAEGKASAKTMLEYLSKEKQKAVQEMMDNRATKYHSIKMGEKAEELDTNNKQRAEHAASGQVTVDHGHGHVEILTGTKATNHINNLRAERDIVADIGTMFDGYTERQKSDILGTLSKKEQLALASSTDFGNVLKKHLTTYQKLENARKSGLTEELSNKIMDVGWDKLNRVRLHDAIKKATDPGDRARLITEWNNLPANAGMPAFHGGATGTGNYEDSQEYRDDLTNASAARNFTRMGSSNAEYIRLEKLYESGLSTPIKPSPERS